MAHKEETKVSQNLRAGRPINKRGLRVYQRVYCWPEDKIRMVDLATKIKKNDKDVFSYLLDVEELHRDDAVKTLEEMNKNKYYNQMKAMLKKDNPQKFKEIFGRGNDATSNT